MVNYKRQKTIETNEEEKVITSFIVSDNICSNFVEMTQPSLFELQASKKVFGWIKQYWDSYHSAPKENIQSMFEYEAPNLEDSEYRLIEEWLKKMSIRFDPQGFNEDYYSEKTKEYLTKQHIIKSSEKAIKLAKGGYIEEAKREVKKFGQIEFGSSLSEWVRPFDDDAFVVEAFSKVDESNILMTLDGALGKLVGPLRRKWLVGVMGPAKKGKTPFLNYAAKTALFSGCRVAHVILEADSYEIAIRHYQAITDSNQSAKFREVSVLDCVHNSDNTCNRPERTCNVGRNHPNYAACNKCKTDLDVFSATFHRKMLQFNEIKPQKVISQLNDLRTVIGNDRYYLRKYNIYSVSVQEIYQDILRLEIQTGFFPDVILIDYLDITKAEKPSTEGTREKHNLAWVAAKQLADMTNTLVVTATQGNRGSFKKETLEEESAYTIQDLENCQFYIDSGLCYQKER